MQGQAFDQKRDSTERASIRSDYTTVWSFMLPRLQWQEAGQLYRTGLWDIASMMLLGMALFRWGFFSNRLSTQQYTGLAIGGLVVGGLLAWLSWPSFELKLVDFAKFYSTHTLPLADLLLPTERACLTIGGASLVILLYRAGISAGLWRAVGAVGQLALSNYLLQTIFCTLFFYGYGMAHFGTLRLHQLYIIVAEIGMVQLVASVVWLRYFRLGPAEWLWRSLMHGQPLPLHRTESTTTSA